jgi:hypothetical protein
VYFIVPIVVIAFTHFIVFFACISSCSLWLLQIPFHRVHCVYFIVPIVVIAFTHFIVFFACISSCPLWLSHSRISSCSLRAFHRAHSGYYKPSNFLTHDGIICVPCAHFIVSIACISSCPLWLSHSRISSCPLCVFHRAHCGYYTPSNLT